ncbi:MAG: hypothetical protein A2271_02430 [Candidatus Moranbacteria bacterium RIFOXYA12_FULL_35_19]|nr:MAG: CBS domain-containing protein [Candidatus Moranbacteria bacterium GW2011_GWF2_35_39]OGI30255.1 MAG: hypothetical protein A2343_00130 [Candidatus Moranbacteria bacterium RIFOXYB12_FULL_35_8]OGI35396.1 MAG: hypothetical protein A2271_02430 [Candidatus Moranbacteria bacterium RIFOXYA12_FULL_35_19]
MKIKDIMIRDVIAVDPETTVSRVADILFTNRFHGLPIVENGKLAGIITEDDFFLKNYDEIYLPSYLRFIEENKSADNLPPEIKDKIEKLLGFKVKDIMTTDCVTVKQDMDISDFMNLVRETKFTTFPVTDMENNLVGIVALSDVLGTVREGSIQMKKAFKGKFKSMEAEELAKELDFLWKEKLVLVSKKNVSTWKGIALVSIISTIGLLICISFILSNI